MILPEAKIILYKGKTLKDNKHPIVLQVKIGTNDYRRISLSMAANSKEWNATDARFRDTKNKEYENRELFDAESKCNEILDQFIQKMKKERSHFDFNRFKAKFLGKDYADTDKPNTLLGFTYWYAEHLREKKRLGNMTSFTTLHSVLKQYETNEDLRLDEINTDFLESLEKKLIQRKNPHTGEPIKLNSVFSYYKTLKSLFNKAIYFGITENYPFRNSSNHRGYSFSHLKSPRISKTMSDEQVIKFFDFDWQNGTRKQKIGWKVAFFIYHFRGMPIGDAARLTKKDIINDQVMFGRIKTKSKVPNVPLNEKRRWIIDLLSPDTDGDHLLPILFHGRHDTEQSIMNRINKMKTIVNTGMKEIAAIQGIDLNLHTYVLRHTFSRKVLEKYGIWHLKEVMGHKSVTTTQSYATSLSSKQLEVTDSVFE